ncbi:aldo/keto reductase [Arthrobacter roseus]
MDQLGFGVYKVPQADTARLCGEAIGCGYRHIDTAALYGNEEGVGTAVRKFLSTGDHQRTDLFVTTKVWNESQGFTATLRAFEESSIRLGLDYVDLYLIHWPCPAKNLFPETYKALERLQSDGRVRAIGVSNFKQAHLEKLLQETSVVPAVNQVELHPWLQQQDLRRFHDRTGIRTEAWSPLGRGAVLSDPDIGRIAVELGKSAAQIILRWHIQCGNIAVPKASSPERIAGNMDIFNFELDQEHMSCISSLDRGQRIGSDPDDIN